MMKFIGYMGYRMVLSEYFLLDTKIDMNLVVHEVCHVFDVLSWCVLGKFSSYIF